MMEQNNNVIEKYSRPLLSICIPIYNRLSFLQIMLERFLEDNSLFEKEIELIISDNCSKDDLQTCVKAFKERGLNVFYHRQDNNLGPDGNFEYCFNNAHGKYMWLLGSDDIPVSGFLRYLLKELDKDLDFGLVYLREGKFNKWYRNVLFDKAYSEVVEDNQIMLPTINVWITFMSASIIKTDVIKSIDLKKYMGTNLIQVPVYIKACLTSKYNLFINYGNCFESLNDNASSGGYNFYNVFVVNLFNILKEFVDEELLSKSAYNLFVRNEYKYYLIENSIYSLIMKKDKIHNLDNAWYILWNNYGKRAYTYYYFIDYTIKRGLSKILKLK